MYHVAGEKNPADIPTRGNSVQQILVSTLQNDPEFLSDKSFVCSSDVNESFVGGSEEKIVAKALSECRKDWDGVPNSNVFLKTPL